MLLRNKINLSPIEKPGKRNNGENDENINMVSEEQLIILGL